MTRVADTSFLYAAFDVDDARHKQSLKGLAKPQRLDVPLAILAEFLDLVTYRHGHKAAARVWDDLAGLGTVHVAQPQDPRKVIPMWAKDGKLSMADAIAIEHAVAQGTPLLSHDRHQLEVLRRMGG